MPAVQEVSARLRDALKRKGKSITWLQKAIKGKSDRGKSYASVHAYTTGHTSKDEPLRTEPPLEFLRAAAGALGVPEAWLITGYGPRDLTQGILEQQWEDRRQQDAPWSLWVDPERRDAVDYHYESTALERHLYWDLLRRLTESSVDDQQDVSERAREIAPFLQSLVWQATEHLAGWLRKDVVEFWDSPDGTQFRIDFLQAIIRPVAEGTDDGRRVATEKEAYRQRKASPPGESELSEEQQAVLDKLREEAGGDS